MSATEQGLNLSQPDNRVVSDLKLKRATRNRIRRLERCLLDVEQWCYNQFVELNSQGADRADNEAYVELTRLRNRVARTTATFK